MQGSPNSPTAGTRPGDRPTQEDTGQERASQAAGTAKERASDVAGTAQERASHAMDSAREHTREVAEHAAEEARGVVHEAADRLHGEAERQTNQLQQAVAQTGSQLEALAEGRVEDAGPLADYARRASSKVDELAGRMDTLGFDGIVSEVSDYARRRPGRFLLYSAAAGVVVGRLGRNLRAAKGDDGSQPGRPQLEARTGGGRQQPRRGTYPPQPGAGTVAPGPAAAGVPPGFGVGPAPTGGQAGETLAGEGPVGAEAPRRGEGGRHG